MNPKQKIYKQEKNIIKGDMKVMKENFIIKENRVAVEDYFGGYNSGRSCIRGFDYCYGREFYNHDDYYYGDAEVDPYEDYYNEMQQYYDEVVCGGGE